VKNGSTVRLNFGCLGIGLISFWWSLIISFPSSVKKKILYFIMGSFAIFIINVLRICSVALAYSSNNALYKSFDHHFIFNFITCGMLFLFAQKRIANSIIAKNEYQ
jgi:hypothetical protein